MWPDWAIFGKKNFPIGSSPNNNCWLFFFGGVFEQVKKLLILGGQVLEKMGYFIFHHLIILPCQWFEPEKFQWRTFQLSTDIPATLNLREGDKGPMQRSWWRHRDALDVDVCRRNDVRSWRRRGTDPDGRPSLIRFAENLIFLNGPSQATFSFVFALLKQTLQFLQQMSIQ